MKEPMMNIFCKTAVFLPDFSFLTAGQAAFLIPLHFEF